MPAITPIDQRFSQLSEERRQIDFSRALPMQQRWSNQHEKRYERRNRISRQTKEQFVLPSPERERLPRLHGHSPELQFSTEHLERFLDQIMLANRNAAGSDAGVVRAAALFQ